jgi:hypothetical protein
MKQTYTSATWFNSNMCASTATNSIVNFNPRHKITILKPNFWLSTTDEDAVGAKRIGEIKEWLSSTVTGGYSVTEYQNDISISFNNEEDLMWFELRWL